MECIITNPIHYYHPAFLHVSPIILRLVYSIRIFGMQASSTSVINTRELT